MGEAAQALARSADAIGKYFADVNPNYGALGKSEECDVSNQQPYQNILVTMRQEDVSDSREAQCCSHRAGEQKFSSANGINEGHGDHGKNQIGGADSHRLQVGRNLAEACLGKYLIQIVENGVDSGKLVEHGNGNCQKYGETVFSVEQRIPGVMLSVNRGNDVLQLLLVVHFAGDAQNFAGFVDVAVFRQPTRAARNAEQHHEEKVGWQRGDTELPAPFGGAEG